jgi:hypothetical protein
VFVGTGGRPGQHAVLFLEERKTCRFAATNVAAGVTMISDGNVAGEHTYGKRVTLSGCSERTEINDMLVLSSS